MAAKEAGTGGLNLWQIFRIILKATSTDISVAAFGNLQIQFEN